MADNLRIAITDLESELTLLFAEFPELAEDRQLRADTVEGSTEVYAVLGRILSIALDAQTMGAAIKERVELLRKRRNAVERREEAMRTIGLRIMTRAGISKAALTEATLTVRRVPPGLTITDETLLPEAFWRVRREPDKIAIKEALFSGRDVPGAVLGNGGQTLAIRVA